MRPIPPSYATARAQFLASAAAADSRIDSFDHPRRGLDDEALAIDVAEVGPTEAPSAIVIVSGTHGVEGYLGSALQEHHLRHLAEGEVSPAGPTMLFVHALNPFGFSWVRRVNEDNVDLNRNFIDWSELPPSNSAYRDLADALVPTSWEPDVQEATLAQLLAHLDQLGMEGFQQAVSGGQFEYPTGLFFGGAGPTWSNRWLTEFATTRLTRFDRVAIIDLHTGLGPWGHGELISSAAPGDAALGRQRAWWGDVTSLHDGSSVSAEVTGDWLGAVDGYMGSTEVTSVAIEYGTVDPITVLQSLRADAVLHGHLDPRSEFATSIRSQVRAAFIDDDPAWLEQCWARYESTCDAAIEALTTP